MVKNIPVLLYFRWSWLGLSPLQSRVHRWPASAGDHGPAALLSASASLCQPNALLFSTNCHVLHLFFVRNSTYFFFFYLE